MPAMPNIQISRIPAMKNSALHTRTISMVWPKSGCITSSATTASSSTSAKALAGISGRFADSPNSQATRMTKAGLRNSDGWILTPNRTSQRRAPLISWPNIGVTATMAMATRNTISDRRRICCGVRNDTASMMAMVGNRKMMWRLTK